MQEHPSSFPFAELRRFHLCLLCRGNDRQDDCTGDFWEEMLLGRHMEPPGLLHRHRRVSLVRWVPLSPCLSVLVHSTAWQMSDLGEQLVCSGEGWGLAGHRGVGVVHPGSAVGTTTGPQQSLWSPP